MPPLKGLPPFGLRTGVEHPNLMKQGGMCSSGACPTSLRLPLRPSLPSPRPACELTFAAYLNTLPLGLMESHAMTCWPSLTPSSPRCAPSTSTSSALACGPCRLSALPSPPLLRPSPPSWRPKLAPFRCSVKCTALGQAFAHARPSAGSVPSLQLACRASLAVASSTSLTTCRPPLT